SGKLTREEIGLDEELFNLLDRNEDRVLDAIELLRYVVIAPDVELTVQLSGKSAARGRAVTLTPGSKANLAKKLRQVGSYGVVLAMQNSRIEVRSPLVVNFGQPQNTQYFTQTFRSIDRGNKGVVELKVLKQPQFQHLSSVFEMADRNNNGQVTRKEFNDYLG